MTTTLASIKTGIRLLLDDPSTEKYTDLQIEECLSIALADYSLFKPLIRTYVLDSNGCKRIPLPADFIARAIVGIERESDPGTFSCDMAFHATLQDEQWVLDLPGMVIPPGEILYVEYETLHTIDGLDGAAGTTVPDQEIAMLALGTAGYAGCARAVSKVESNNLNTREAKDLYLLSTQQIDSFHTFFGRIPAFPFRSATWNDTSMDKNY